MQDKIGKLTMALNYFGESNFILRLMLIIANFLNFIGRNTASGKLLQEGMPVFLFPCARGGVSQEESRKAGNCGWVS